MANDYISQVTLPNNVTYDLRDDGAVRKTGSTMTGALKFSGNDSRSITWEDGTWYQRILTTDDSASDTTVFTFQQTSNSGGDWTDLFTIKDNGTVVATTFSGSILKLNNYMNFVLTGAGTAAVTSGTKMPALWRFDLGIASPTEGDIVTIKIPVAGHGNGVFVSLDNGTTYYPVSVSGTGALTTHYAKGQIITLVCVGSGGTNSIYPAQTTINSNSYTLGTAANITGKHWCVINYYDSGNTNTATRQKVRSTNANYSLLFADPVVGTADNNTNYYTYRNDSIYVNPSIGTIYATTFTGNLTGNASTATSWANARKVYVALGTASKTTTINGGASDAAAIALGIDGTLGIDHGGTNATTAAGARANLGTWALVSDSYNTLMPADGTTNGWIKIGKSNTSYGLLPSASGGAGSGHNYIGTSSWYWKYAYIDEIYGHLNGNANTATAIKTAGTTAQFYRGDNSWSNTLTDSLNISKAGAVGIEVDNTQATNPNKVAFIVGSSGNGGIYSHKHAKWIVYADASGNVVLNGNANTATKVGTDSIWLYPESNNKLNFGGTNNSTTIYLGYEAKDSRGIPTKFIFGNSTGTADIQAAKLIGGSGSFTLQWNSTDSSIDFVFA